MKMSAMPDPMTRKIHSSKFFGLLCARVLFTFASTRPVKHLIWMQYTEIRNSDVGPYEHEKYFQFQD